MNLPLRTHPGANRPMRFVVVGVWNTVFGYLAFAGYWWVFEQLAIHYMLALVAAQLTAIANSWLMHRLFVFGTEASAAGSFLRYQLIYWPMFAANLALLPVLVEGAALHPLLAQGLLAAATAVASYVAHSRYTFRA